MTRLPVFFNSPTRSKEVSESNKVVKIHFTVYTRKDKPKQELKQIRENVKFELEDIYTMDISLRRAHVSDAFNAHYTFTPLQRNQILENEGKLNKFIELHIKILEGVLSIKKSPTRYIAAILFPKAVIG